MYMGGCWVGFTHYNNIFLIYREIFTYQSFGDRYKLRDILKTFIINGEYHLQLLYLEQNVCFCDRNEVYYP